MVRLLTVKPGAPPSNVAVNAFDAPPIRRPARDAVPGGGEVQVPRSTRSQRSQWRRSPSAATPSRSERLRRSWRRSPPGSHRAVAVKVPADCAQLRDSSYLDEAIVIPVVVNCCLGARGGVHPPPPSAGAALPRAMTRTLTTAESHSLSACQALPQGDNGPLSQSPSLSVAL